MKSKDYNRVVLDTTASAELQKKVSEELNEPDPTKESAKAAIKDATKENK